jgi:hypothetical protein
MVSFLYNWTGSFYIFIDYQGRHRKGIIIYDVTKVNLQQKSLFQWKKIIFWNYRKVKKQEQNF